MAFKVYINGYLDEDGNTIESSSDTLMFEVPLADTAPCSTATVKSQEDSADSFDFSMEPNSEYYDRLVPLKTRLLGRGTETEDIIMERISKAHRELTLAAGYDYIVINDDVDVAANEVISIIESEHLRVDRVVEDYYSFIGTEDNA